MNGRAGDVKVQIFDYTYSTGGGKSSHTWKQTVFLFESGRCSFIFFSGGRAGFLWHSHGLCAIMGQCPELKPEAQIGDGM